MFADVSGEVQRPGSRRDDVSNATELVPWETKPSILGGYKLQDYLNKVGPVRKKNARFQCAGHMWSGQSM